jgi:hypothetical protein
MKVSSVWNAYRAASIVLMLYCALHSYGALISTPHFGAASDAVLESMRSVRFDAQGFDDTWYGFYLGFGWFSSVLFAVSALQLWIIGGRSLEERRKERAIVGSLALAYVAGVWLCARYFHPAALVFAVVALGTILWAMISDARASRRTVLPGAPPQQTLVRR